MPEEKIDHIHEALKLLNAGPVGSHSHASTAHTHAVLAVAEEIRALRLALVPPTEEQKK